MPSPPEYAFIGHWQNLIEEKMLYWTHWVDNDGSQLPRDYLQSSEFGHMIETCNRQSGDVVIVESAVK